MFRRKISLDRKKGEKWALDPSQKILDDGHRPGRITKYNVAGRGLENRIKRTIVAKAMPAAVRSSLADHQR